MELLGVVGRNAMAKLRGRLNHEVERLRDGGWLVINDDGSIVVENTMARAECRSLKDFERRRLELLDRWGGVYTSEEFLILRPDFYPPPPRRPVLAEDEAAEAARQRYEEQLRRLEERREAVLQLEHRHRAARQSRTVEKGWRGNITIEETDPAELRKLEAELDQAHEELVEAQVAAEKALREMNRAHGVAAAARRRAKRK